MPRLPFVALTTYAIAALAGGALAGCDPLSEEEFLRGRSYDPCLQTIPACPGLFASCTLDETRYSRMTFPGEFRFLVRAEAGQDIAVVIFLAQQRDAGLQTLIYWNEPGCSEVYAYDSEGRDLFQESEETSLIEERRTMLETGEHLIEIFSDMQADVLISARVIIPGT